MDNTVSTNFHLELIEPSAEVIIFWILVEEKRENGSNLTKLEKASGLNKMLTHSLLSRRLYKLQAKIS